MQHGYIIVVKKTSLPLLTKIISQFNLMKTISLTTVLPAVQAFPTHDCGTKSEGQTVTTMYMIHLLYKL